MSDFRLVLKRWGFEAWITATPLYTAKLLFVEPSPAASSLHYHVHKDETFICLFGRVNLEVGDGVGGEPDRVGRKARCLRVGDTVHLPPGTLHLFRDGPGLLLEVSTSILGQEDCVRLTASQGVTHDYHVGSVAEALSYGRCRCDRQ